MARITMREAISQALWEEMERDPKVFIMGEEVGVWGGTYAVTKGFYDHFGPERVKRYPDCRGGHHWCGHRRRHDRAAPGGGIDDDQLRFFGDGSHCQRGCQDALYVQRSVGAAAGHPRGGRGRAPVGRHPLPDPGCDFRPFPRA